MWSGVFAGQLPGNASISCMTMTNRNFSSLDFSINVFELMREGKKILKFITELNLDTHGHVGPEVKCPVTK